MQRNKEHKQAILEANRIVIKVGTRLLVHANGRPNLEQIKILVAQISTLHKQGKEVILVTSGAIGAGIEALNLKKRPARLPDLQMAAAIGQTRLMTEYDKLFTKKNCQIAQVLLTHSDLNDRVRHLNARNTLMNLLRNHIIPVINENDVVSVNEIQVGDNDQLASLVSILVGADLLIMLTSVNGFRLPAKGSRTKRVPLITEINEEIKSATKGKGSNLSTGGMLSKLEAAEQFAQTGGLTLIADGKNKNILQRLVTGEDIGTLVHVKTKKTTKRKNWIAYFNRPKGSLKIDKGASEALLSKGKSLLPIGIKKVEGDFKQGDCVNICDHKGNIIATGLSDYDKGDVERIKGKSSKDIVKILGSRSYDAVVHRDNLVLL